MYKQISMKDIIDENSRNRHDDGFNNDIRNYTNNYNRDNTNAYNNLNLNNKSLLDKVDSTSSNFKPLIKKKDDVLNSKVKSKDADTTVVRLANLG